MYFSQFTNSIKPLFKENSKEIQTLHLYVKILTEIQTKYDGEFLLYKSHQKKEKQKTFKNEQKNKLELIYGHIIDMQKHRSPNISLLDYFIIHINEEKH